MCTEDCVIWEFSGFFVLNSHKCVYVYYSILAKHFFKAVNLGFCLLIMSHHQASHIIVYLFNT